MFNKSHVNIRTPPASASLLLIVKYISGTAGNRGKKIKRRGLFEVWDCGTWLKLSEFGIDLPTYLNKMIIWRR